VLSPQGDSRLSLEAIRQKSRGSLGEPPRLKIRCRPAGSKMFGYSVGFAEKRSAHG
jgi:hypothetical protein